MNYGFIKKYSVCNRDVYKWIGKIAFTVCFVAIIITYNKQIEIIRSYADLFFVFQIINDQWSTGLLHTVQKVDAAIIK